ncbi:MAG TPA: hypothetical protein P5049_00555 [Methanothrix sp.]|nr:hypothetical protein [Methanothrix sp.]
MRKRTAMERRARWEQEPDRQKLFVIEPMKEPQIAVIEPMKPTQTADRRASGWETAQRRFVYILIDF